MNSINEYEIVVIIRPDLDDPTTYAIIERLEGIIADAEGHLLMRDDWGKRKLAYPIAKHQKGHYVLLHFLSQATIILELERVIRISDSVVRFLTVKISENVDVEEKKAQAEETRKIREAQARARAEALEDEDDDTAEANL